jgi:hypothetical protein
MKAVFLGVDVLETTAAIFRVGVYRTRRPHIAEFLQPICAMTVPYYNVSRVTMTKTFLDIQNIVHIRVYS